MKFKTVTEARSQLPELVTSPERTTLTRNGQPVAVLMRYDDYEALQALLTLAQDPQRLARILDGHARVQHGELEGFVDLEVPQGATDGHSVHENSA